MIETLCDCVVISMYWCGSRFVIRYGEVSSTRQMPVNHPYPLVDPFLRSSSPETCRHHVDDPMDIDDSIDTKLPSHSSKGSMADYMESDHRQMDEQVAKQLNEFGMDGSHDPSIAELSIVLRCVVDCDDRLGRGYLDPIAGTKLLRSNELLKSKVADALKTGSYRDVRNLSTHVNHL